MTTPQPALPAKLLLLAHRVCSPRPAATAAPCPRCGTRNSPPWGRYNTKLSFILRIRCTTTQMVRVGQLSHAGMPGHNAKFSFKPDTCVQVTPAQGTVEFRLAPYYEALGQGRTYAISVSSLPKAGGDFTLELAYDAARMPGTLPSFEVKLSYSHHKVHSRGRTASYSRFERAVVHLAELPAEAPAYFISLANDYDQVIATRESRGGKEAFSPLQTVSILQVTVTRRCTTGGTACTQTFRAQQVYFPDR